MGKSKKITFLDSVQNRWILVVLSAFFGTAFMLIYDPLTIKTIIIYSWLGRFLTVNAAAVVGALTVASSQFVLRPLFKIDSFRVSTFISWVALEMFLISIVIFIIFKETQDPNWEEYRLVTKYSVGIALPPYLLACLILLLKESRSRANMPAPTDPQISTTITPLSKQYWKIKDTNDKEQLIVRSDMLLYIESDNNYIDVSFIDGDEVKKKSIRNTLKNLEQDPLAPSLLRVHRSYMVNLDKVSHINREGPKWSIKLSHVDTPEIPISASYQKPLELAMS